MFRSFAFPKKLFLITKMAERLEAKTEASLIRFALIIVEGSELLDILGYHVEPFPHYLQFPAR